MKKIVVAIMVLTMMVSAIAAMAQSEKSFSITPRIAAHFFSNSDAKDNLGTAYGILADIDVASLPVGFEIGYMTGKKTRDTKIPVYEEGYLVDEIDADQKCSAWAIPVLATYTYPFSENFYAKAGAGVAFVHAKAEISVSDAWAGVIADESYSKTKTNFAFKVGVGAKFAQNWSAELFYADYGKAKIDDDADGIKTGGIELNVGYTF
ncbi:MAG: porin family protein [Abditibacteriota bacterium]|nr:porin family protein [Abditibacteriota bacterium]